VNRGHGVAERQRGELFVTAIEVWIAADQEVLPPQALAKRHQDVSILIGRPGVEKSDHRHHRLLRGGSERPPHRRTTKNRRMNPRRCGMRPPTDQPVGEGISLLAKHRCSHLKKSKLIAVMRACTSHASMLRHCRLKG
jgi:hypothetical protein